MNLLKVFRLQSRLIQGYSRTVSATTLPTTIEASTSSPCVHAVMDTKLLNDFIEQGGPLARQCKKFSMYNIHWNRFFIAMFCGGNYKTSKFTLKYNPGTFVNKCDTEAFVLRACVLEA